MTGAIEGRDAYVHRVALMGTVVAIQVVGSGETNAQRAARAESVGRAVDWFRRIEACCSRFDPASELRQLVERPGQGVPASTMLLEAVRFAIALAEETDGAFDPTVGRRMEARGFDRDYRTGARTGTSLDDDDVSYRDVFVDLDRQTITLARPLLLDLGAVAKGLAVDMAARELEPFEHFAVDAGGDLYLSGLNPLGQPWTVGLRHPRADSDVMQTVRVSNTAVCTSGDYERRGTNGEHHIIDGRTGNAANAAASVTVIARSAMVADGLATAAFALGPGEGMALLRRQGVEGLIVTPALERFATSGFPT